MCRTLSMQNHSKLRKKQFIVWTEMVRPEYKILFFAYCLIKSTRFETILQQLSMDSKNIIEAEDIYLYDHYKGRNVIQTLNAINEADKPDSESIFCQTSTGEESFSYPEPVLYRKNQRQTDIFSVLDIPSTSLIEQVVSNQEISIHDRLSENGAQVASPQLSESQEEEVNSQFVCGRKRKGIKRANLNEKAKKIDKQKNIFPNIAKRTSKIMFEDCRKFTQKFFQKRNIDFAQFEEEYGGLLESNCSGLALSSYFTYKDSNLEKMSHQFVALFQRFLRKRYMILAMKRGKMDDLETYISCKNRQLMYFSQYLNSQARV